MGTFAEKEVYQIIHCCNCGMSFAMTNDFYRRRLDDHKSFWCPAGHGQHFYGATEAQKLQKQLEQQIQRTNRAESNASQYRHERDQVTKAHRRMRQRVMNGVCPCCNRSFSNLRNHMASEHPDFGHEQTMRALREAFGMTQVDVAKEASVNPIYVSHYERGKPMPVEARNNLDWWLQSQSGGKRA